MERKTRFLISEDDLSPKPNKVVKRGSPYEIQWKADPAESEFGAMVTVEFSKDLVLL